MSHTIIVLFKPSERTMSPLICSRARGRVEERCRCQRGHCYTYGDTSLQTARTVYNSLNQRCRHTATVCHGPIDGRYRTLAYRSAHGSDVTVYLTDEAHTGMR